MLGHSEIFNELKTLADKGELAHGYIFFGMEGVGKKTLALRLARYLEHGNPDEEKILGDATIISPENGSLGIDAVREIRGFLSQKPNVSKWRTLIIDNGELMTEEAGNALLKIAEEPPPSSLIILMVRDPEQIGPTLASRFEKIYFGPVQKKDIESWLVKEKKITKAKAEKIAEASFGRPSLALLMLQNENFSEAQTRVKKYLSAKPATLKPFLKSMLDNEDFKLKDFLDALILELAWDKKRNLAAWHKVLELRHTAEYFGLNPRIQLEALHRYFR